MKLFSLLLPVVAAAIFQSSALGQGVAGSAELLRGTLGNMTQGVGRQYDKDEAKDLLNNIERARENLAQLRDLAERNAPRDTVGDPLQKAVARLGEILRKTESRRAGEPMQRLAGDARDRLAALEAAWLRYQVQQAPPPPRGGGGGFVDRGGMSEERAQNIAARELANSLRVPPDNVTITRLERDRGRYRATGVVRGAGRYVVELDADSGRVFSVNPLR